MSLFDQLARCVLQTSDRASRSFFNSSVALSTDIGIVRSENQDRVIFARLEPHGLHEPLNLAILSDGMGGMVDGAVCATLTVAGFLEALAFSQVNEPLASRLELAAHAANEVVYRDFLGRGGATLSVIAWHAGEAVFTVNVGDSRVYHQDVGAAGELSRLTVDDTMSEAFGGEGKSLIQYIGLGKGLKPHVRSARAGGIVIATTDGVHFMDHHFLSEIVRNAPTPKSKADRAIALARWLGGPDNASIAIVDLDEFPPQPSLSGAQLEIWPCGADQTCVWMAPHSPRPAPPADGSGKTEESTKHPSKSGKKRRPTSKKAKQEAQGQLQIEVEVVEDKDADS